MNGRVVAAVALLVLSAGCVDRRITFRSKPAGALIYVNDVEVGRTPVTVPFTWYGDYDIQLRLGGHQTISTNANINAPWYEIPPLDLLSAVAPWTYEDHRYLYYEMETLRTPTTQAVLERAEELRLRNEQNVAE